MKITVKNVASYETGSELIGVPLLEGEQAPKAFSEAYDSLKKGEFEGKSGQQSLVNPGKGTRVLFYGLGKENEVDADSFRKVAGAVVRAAKGSKCEKAALILSKRFEKFAQSVAEGAVLAEYKFTKFKTSKEDKPAELKELLVICSESVSHAIKKGEMLAQCQNYVREMDETPANIMTPQRIAGLAKELAKEIGLGVTIYEKDELKKIGMNGILAVNQGSVLPPALVVLEYNKTKKELPLYCIVGKGITFDSGGISLKPSKGMHEMKYDKTGALVVLGVMRALSELKLPIRVTGLMPLTENMPSGTAQKPGDIITAYNGKTIEVLNTDAEGRLILADALAFAAEKKPKAIIDLATLTGAIITCLGPHAAGLFTNDDNLAKILSEAGEETRERVWRLPIWKEYADFIKSDFADIKNIGSEIGEASSITASKFLQEFVGETKWAHLDIAGVDNIRGSHPYMERGASGIGVRLIVSALEKIEK